DALAAHRDPLCPKNTAFAGIEYRNILDDQVARRLVRQLFCQFAGPKGLHLALDFLQRGNGRLEALTNERRPPSDAGEKLLVPVQPKVAWREGETINRVQSYGQLFTVNVDRSGFKLAHAGFAAREQPQLAALAAQQGAHQQNAGLWSCVKVNIKLAGGIALFQVF